MDYERKNSPGFKEGVFGSGCEAAG